MDYQVSTTTAGITLHDGDTMEVQAGGVATRTTAFGGPQWATINVESGGVANSTVLSGAVAIEFVEPNGADNNATVNNGGGLEIEGNASKGPGTGTGATINNGGALTVDNFGVANNATINKGGNEFVDGTDNNTTLSGGRQFIQRGNTPGVANATIILSGGFQQVYGVANNAQISGGGGQDIVSGGIANDAGGSAFDSIITSKGLTFVEAGASGVDITVGSGGTMKLAGAATNIIISGGLLDLVEGYSTDGILGFASDVGVLKVEGTTMPSTPIRHLVKGDLIDLASVPFSFGKVTVLGGNVLRIIEANPFTLSHFTGILKLAGYYSSKSFALANDGAGGTLVFLSSTLTVTSGQTLAIGGATGNSQALAGHVLASQPLAAQPLTGQTLDGVDVLSGGTYLVKSGGTAIYTAVDGGTFNIQSGGVADTNALNTGVMNVSAGGVAIGTTISSGGRESVAGTDLGGIVNDGGTQAVLSGGLASGTFLNDPGTQIVSSGGTAAGVVISGGEQDVFGSAVGTIVTAGQQFVSRGGLASGTTLGVGGTQRVASGGTANGTTIEFGGTAVIQSGGTLGAATLDGGTLVLSAGVLLNGGVSVPADGTLVIGGTAIPAHLLIGGFGAGDKIDLAAIAFDSGAGTALASGTNVLEVIESGSTYFISFGSDISADTFLLAPDGGGGTVVTLNDAFAVGSGQTLTVSSGETSTGVDVLSGGTLLVLAGATASGAVIHGGGSEIVSAAGSDRGATVRGGGVQDVRTGGSADGAFVSGGGVQVVESGGTADNTILTRGGTGWYRASVSMRRSEAVASTSSPPAAPIQARRSPAARSRFLVTRSIRPCSPAPRSFNQVAPRATPCSAAAAKWSAPAAPTSAPRSQAASRMSSATPSA